MSRAHTLIISVVQDNTLVGFGSGCSGFTPTIGSSKTLSWLEPVLRCEPSTYQPFNRSLATVPLMPIIRSIGLLSKIEEY